MKRGRSVCRSEDFFTDWLADLPLVHNLFNLFTKSSRYTVPLQKQELIYLYDQWQGDDAQYGSEHVVGAGFCRMFIIQDGKLGYGGGGGRGQRHGGDQQDHGKFRVML